MRLRRGRYAVTEAAYDVRRPNASPLRQDSRIRTVWRLYRREDLVDLGSVPKNRPVGFLATAQDRLRDAREIVQKLTPRNPRGRGKLVREVRCALLIHNLATETDVRSGFTYVRDGKPGENFFLDVPFRNAKGITHIRLSGRTFRGPIVVNGVPVDGQAALNELEKLFEDYLNPRVGSPADYRLYWMNLDAPVSAEDPFGASEWWVHPPRRALRKVKSVARPHDWMWSIDLYGLQSNRDVEKSEDGFLASLFGTSALRALLERFGLEAILDGIAQVFAVIDEFSGLIDDITAMVTSVLDYVTGIQQLIRMSIAKVRGVLNRVQELIARVENGIRQVRNLPNMIAAEARLVRQSFPGLVGNETAGHLLNDELRNLRDLSLALLAQPQHFAELVSGAPVLPQSILVRVQPETTVERIAHDSGATVEALIELNRLEYPFVESRERPETHLARLVAEQAQFTAGDAVRATQGLPPLHTEELAILHAQIEAATAEVEDNPARPGVLYAGDPVRIPFDRPELIPSVVGIDGGRLNLIAATTGTEVSEEARVFGIDLYLSSRGDLEWDPDAMDLRVVRGLDNVRAVLARYMRLPLGALRFAPQIGNFAYDDLSRWQTGAESRMLARSIHETLLQDPRIRRLRGIHAVTQGGRTLLRFDADLIGGRHLPDLRVPLDEVA